MTIELGTKLGPYEITGAIGAGGMGEVYRATDTKLERDVAIKVLPVAFVEDKERLARFEREAKLLAQLNHPNIAHIYGMEESGDSHALVMELVPGATLAERISGAEGTERAGLKPASTEARPLPLAEALPIARQIAEALEYAHEHGVIHRDLKPANIKLTGDDQVKVLDFGLAKAMDTEAATGVGASVDLSHSPTMTLGGTVQGMILGTAGYMAPEQAAGKTVDKRADIWAFGVVLYEMLTGAKLFEGDSVPETLAGVLKGEIDLAKLPEETPWTIRRLLARCLERNPKNRLRDIGEARIMIEEAITGVGADGVRPGERASDQKVGARRGPLRRLLPWAVAGLFLVLVAVSWLARGRVDRARSAETSAVQPSQFVRVTTASGVETHPTLSPDGTFVSYTGGRPANRDIYLQRVGGSRAINLTASSPVADIEPAFAPDGQHIAFRSDRDGGGIFVMGATGESVRRLTDEGFDPAWSPDGKRIVFAGEGISGGPWSRSGVSALYTVPAAGGAVKKIFAGDAVQPQWSPHGERIAFWGLFDSNSGQRDIGTIAADGSDVVRVTDDTAMDWDPVWSANGHWLYFASDRGGTMNLWRVRIAEESGKVLGDPEPMTVPSPSAGFLAVRRQGDKIAYVSDESRSNIERIAFDPVHHRLASAPRAVTTGSNQILESNLSPSGDWFVVTELMGRQMDLEMIRTDGSRTRRLTDDLFKDRGPSWSPDGQEILFYADRTGRYEVWSIRPDGSGLRQLTSTTGRSWWYPQMAPDGRKIAVTNETGSALIPLAGDHPTTRVERLPPPAKGKLFYLSLSSWSPRGGRLAGVSVSPHLGSATDAIAVYSLADRSYQLYPLGHRSQLTGPFWLPDGRNILFQDEEGLAVLDLSTSRIERIPGLSASLELTGVSRDGKELYLLNNSNEADIWLADLK